MEIEWDDHEASTRNRGTDGHGVVAHYDVVGGDDAKVVHLNFHFYVEDVFSLSGRKLSHLSRAIGALIHKHLEPPGAVKNCVKCDEVIEDPELNPDEDERCENCADF